VQQAAAEVKKSVKICGTIEVWGDHLVRPGDQLYDLTEARADGDTLKIKLHLAMDNSDVQIEVEGADGAKVSKGALKVRSAKRVRAFGTDYTPPAGSKEPALHLGP